MIPFSDILHGFAVAFEPQNILFALIGALVGTIIGALPGLGPSATIAILLPLTIGLEPVSALIMFVGIYTGAMYGGSITTILVNAPGESASVVTALDGYQLARQGRAGAALGMAAISSFAAGTLAVVLLMFGAPLLSSFALRLGPPEYFAILLLGFALLAFMGGRSKAKVLVSLAAGLLVATVGADPVSGQNRFTFGVVDLIDGVDFVIVAMGVFALAEILVNLRTGMGTLQASRPKWRSVYPKRADLRETWPSMLRGGLVGFFVGVLPGAGATIASLFSYGVERRLSKRPETFGKGAMAGVVAPEGANNAATAGALVPLLTLGIPGSGATAVMLGGLVLYGVQPGPLLMQEQPALVWGVIASLYLANVVLLVLNLPLVPLFASVLRMPYHYLSTLVFLVAVIGAFSLRNNVVDVLLLAFFTLLGYGMRRLGYPAAPFVLAVVLGPMLERSLNQSLTISQGDLGVFVQRPISLGVLCLTVLLLLASAVGPVRRLLSKSDDAVPGEATNASTAELERHP
ncbi:MAG: tripartite tricarboxylate transporter permease [Streptosporangiales bacterium]|nr:tripartite tricarboxylate transporter permease [Streptosporangiales bacterium]